MWVWRSIRYMLRVYFLLMLCIPAQKVFANELFYGTGEPNVPYQIATVQDLIWILIYLMDGFLPRH